MFVGNSGLFILLDNYVTQGKNMQYYAILGSPTLTPPSHIFFTLSLSPGHTQKPLSWLERPFPLTQPLTTSHCLLAMASSPESDFPGPSQPNSRDSSASSDASFPQAVPETCFSHSKPTIVPQMNSPRGKRLCLIALKAQFSKDPVNKMTEK